MIKFSIPIFLHFCTQQVFLKYLAKFQSTTHSITHVFWTFISENLPPPLILGKKGSKNMSSVVRNRLKFGKIS